MARLAKWHWVEDESGVVEFVGSQADALRWYKRHGGERAGYRLFSAFRELDGEKFPRPVVGQVIR